MEDIYYSSLIVLYDNNNDRKLSFLKQINSLFNITITQTTNIELNDTFKRVLGNGIFMVNFVEIFNKFDPCDIFGNNYLSLNKIIIIDELNETLLNNKNFCFIIDNYKDFNITFVFLNISSDVINNNTYKIRQRIDSLIISNNVNSNDIYNIFFKQYPNREQFTEKCSSVQNTEYMYYIKNSLRYMSTSQRYIIVPIHNFNDTLLFDKIKEEDIKVII